MVNNQNTTATLADEDLILLSCKKDECNVSNPYIEWVIKLTASYDAIPSKKFFISYKVGDFNTVKIGNHSYTDIMRVRDIYV